MSGKTVIDCFSYTKSKETGKGTDNYVVKARLLKHVPEVLPIAGKRLYISYPGQLRQCRKCFEQGHASIACTKTKVDWLDYVLTLKGSGTFKQELFDGWKQALDLYRPDPNTSDLRNVINFNKNQQNQNPGPSVPTPTQTPTQPTGQPPQPPINPWGNQTTTQNNAGPWQNNSGPWQTQNPWQNPGQNWQNQNWSNSGQNWSNPNQSWPRGRGRGRGRASNTQRNFGPNY